MQATEEAKERLCQSLLTKVSVFDRLLEETNLKTEQEKIQKLYAYQSSLLNRLERVVTQ